MTALHEAVKQGRVSDVEALLRAGDDPNALDESGAPPLRYVLSYRLGFTLEPSSEQIIRALLAAGADPTVANVGRIVVDEAYSMVCSAAEANQAAGLARLLNVRA